MTKRYFGKFSWVDPKNVMLRVHQNTTLYLDLTKDEYEIAVTAKQALGYGRYDLEELTIDFLIECEEE